MKQLISSIKYFTKDTLMFLAIFVLWLILFLPLVCDAEKVYVDTVFCEGRKNYSVKYQCLHDNTIAKKVNQLIEKSQVTLGVPKTYITKVEIRDIMVDFSTIGYMVIIHYR